MRNFTKWLLPVFAALGFDARGGEVAAAASDPTNVVAIAARIHQQTAESPANLMLAYTNLIAGTKVSYAMLPIPGGEFLMGSRASDPHSLPAEQPAHRVRLAPFWMGRCEVTWNEFNAFVFDDIERRQSSPPSAERKMDYYLADAVSYPTLPYVDMDFGMGKSGYPAIGMTQHAANKYCQWLSARTGHFYRLPTEAEWEYAARAGSTNVWCFGDDPMKLADYAWFETNSDFKYQKVGSKLPNSWGLHDMFGNVSEWVLDQFDSSFYSSSARANPAIDPWNRATQQYPHVVRGGSWRDGEANLRCAARGQSTPDWKAADPQLPRSVFWMRSCDFVGFRIVRPLRVPGAEEMGRYWNSGVERE